MWVYSIISNYNYTMLYNMYPSVRHRRCLLMNVCWLLILTNLKEPNNKIYKWKRLID